MDSRVKLYNLFSKMDQAKTNICILDVEIFLRPETVNFLFNLFEWAIAQLVSCKFF